MPGQQLRNTALGYFFVQYEVIRSLSKILVFSVFGIYSCGLRNLINDIHLLQWISGHKFRDTLNLVLTCNVVLFCTTSAKWHGYLFNITYQLTFWCSEWHDLWNAVKNTLQECDMIYNYKCGLVTAYTFKPHIMDLKYSATENSEQIRICRNLNNLLLFLYQTKSSM
jgi:hypothetical protein